MSQHAALNTKTTLRLSPALSAVFGLSLLTAAGVGAGEAASGGAFTCDFGLSSTLRQDQVAPSIERDRMYMAARPGLLHKHIPISFDADNNVFSGGRYLFDTARHAEEYRDWVFHSYVLDGVHFLKRPYFLSPECHAWTVIGAHDFAEIYSPQIVLRTERWSLRNARHPALILKQRFDAVMADAQKRGLTSVWLLYDEEDGLASLVYFGGRLGPSDPRQPDLASLDALAAAPPLGDIFADQGWKRTFDRTQWALAIWFPFALGDRGEPALWPNTPPFFLPSESDGVCEVGRGESAANAPLDCPPQCGDGTAQTGESSMNCPGDVRLFQ
ncbi:MAG TPA: hypothetical protein VFQ82_15795 [Stellaceae bacterium]|nr:hypothetical protein [Stellaceae bacterium]